MKAVEAGSDADASTTDERDCTVHEAGEPRERLPGFLVCGIPGGRSPECGVVLRSRRVYNSPGWGAMSQVAEPSPFSWGERSSKPLLLTARTVIVDFAGVLVLAHIGIGDSVERVNLSGTPLRGARYASGEALLRRGGCALSERGTVELAGVCDGGGRKIGRVTASGRADLQDEKREGRLR